jgi:acid phosphatase family membrane protein YuiD
MPDYVNLPLIAAFAAWFIAQFIKTIIYAVKYKRFNAERIFGAGGMPSAHSAATAALCTLIFRISGPGSVEFALAVGFALVTMYDATSVRRAAGMHASALNRLYRMQHGSGSAQSQNKPLKEYLGHSPLEVLCGALLGIAVGLAMIFIFIPVVPA